MSTKRFGFLSLTGIMTMVALSACGTGGKKEIPMSFAKDDKSYVFPKNVGFDDADSLPETDHCVAFCPKAAGYTHVYLWSGDGPEPTGASTWPGVQIFEDYNDKWLKVDLEGTTKTNIIFNTNGSPQTKDMEMTHAGYYFFWISDGNLHEEVPESAWVDRAKFTDEKTISLVANQNIDSFKLYEGETEILNGEPGYNAVKIDFGTHKVDLEKTYHVKVTISGVDKVFEENINLNALFDTDLFNKSYAYDGNDLGANYAANETEFKVWSPLSSSVKLRIYDSGTPSYLGGSDTHTEVEMVKGDKGVWSYKVSGDQAGKYYTYVVTNADWTEKEVVDPYAKSAGVNGARGMVVDFASTNPEGWDAIAPKPYDRKQLAVWECHIADLTSDDTWEGTEANRRRFAGFHEAGTTYTDGTNTVKTGFDHVKELGVNAVQILPFFDQANDEVNPTFNWGYNPLNYNVIEGAYSSNPYDGAVRVREFKELVADYNKAGINIIMDVVYNHVSGAQGSNFDVLVPGYFYRYNSAGNLTNGSGCGNETASERYMMRKFMIDSVCFWAKEYKLGGFRFDLMGLHDLTTMNQLTAAAKKINPNIVIYGEPWTGGTSPLPDKDSAKQINGDKYVGYGQFNDQMRDALIKGGMNDKSLAGWATSIDADMSNELKTIVQGIKGATNDKITDPNKTVNYAACHDNYTLSDRAYWLVRNTAYNPKMSMLANSVVFTSQGTSFMLSGDEFLRTKGHNGNSYGGDDLAKVGLADKFADWYDVNSLKWDLKIQHLDMVENYKKLIALKTTVDGLALEEAEAKNMDVQMIGGNTVVYTIRDAAHGKTYKIAHANGVGTIRPVDFEGYSVYLDTLNSNVALSSSTALQNFQTLIGVK